MTRATPTTAQLPPELRQLVDDVTAVLTKAADPAAAAHEFARLLPGCLAAVQRTEEAR